LSGGADLFHTQLFSKVNGQLLSDTNAPKAIPSTNNFSGEQYLW